MQAVILASSAESALDYLNTKWYCQVLDCRVQSACNKPTLRLARCLRIWNPCLQAMIEEGWIGMPRVLQHPRRCTFCATNAVSIERYCVFDCPHSMEFPEGPRQQLISVHNKGEVWHWVLGAVGECAIFDEHASSVHMPTAWHYMSYMCIVSRALCQRMLA